jgi:hypothetical protein
MDMDGNDDMILTRLRLDINETKLQEIFGAYGTVVSCKVLILPFPSLFHYPSIIFTSRIQSKRLVDA